MYLRYVSRPRIVKRSFIIDFIGGRIRTLGDEFELAK